MALPNNGVRRTVAFVGTGHRAEMFFAALLGDHSDDAVPVALCDPNPGRMGYYQDLWSQAHPGVELETYELDTAHPVAFERMLENHNPDVVVVATVDRTHAHYVVSALDHGCDVICEKPLTTSLEGCREIADAAQRSEGRLTVTFNYRYSPRNSMVKRLVAGGEIGTVTSVHFEWLLDTQHGADYFRRWHRDKANSGGLFVHKATHHFDLINWWLDDRPETVTAHADLRFYGSQNAKDRGVEGRYERSRDAILADPTLDDPFALDIEADERLRKLYLDNEDHDGYLRDEDVFADGVTIEDNMAMLARFTNGALLTYSLHAHAPWEGYRVALNGTAGRIELDVVERPATKPPRQSDQPDSGDRVAGTWLTVQRQWGPAERIDITSGDDDHGGGDALLLADLFGPATADPLGRKADYQDGLNSVLTGLAANESVESGSPVVFDDFGAGIIKAKTTVGMEEA